MNPIRGLLVIASLVAGCTGPSEPSEPSEHDAHDEAPTSLRAAWVEVKAPADATLLELPARVVAAADSRARLDAAFRGAVVSVSVRAGDRVEVGDPIVELRVPELLQAAAILSGTSVQIGSHKLRRERLEDLQGKGLVGASEVFELDSRLGTLSADRRLALATLRAAGIDANERGELLRRGTIVLDSPIAGVIAELAAVPGDVVEPGESLAQILGTGSARIEVAYTGTLPAGVELEFIGSEGTRFALTEQPVATAIEPGLGRTLAWFEPAEPRELADGLRGRVLLHGQAAGLLEVPRRALRLHEGKAWVAVRPEHAGDPPVEVEVEVLRSVGSSALVRSATLELGDQVAADAATVLMVGRDPSQLGGDDHGH